MGLLVGWVLSFRFKSPLLNPLQRRGLEQPRPCSFQFFLLPLYYTGSSPMIATLLNNTLPPQNISLLYNSVCVCVCVCVCVYAFKLTPAFVFTNLLVAIFLKAATFLASGKAGKAISHKIYALTADAVSHIFKNMSFAVPGIAHILQNMRFPSYPNEHILQNMRFPSCTDEHILQNTGFPSCPNEHILQNMRFPSYPNGHILQNMRFPSYPNGHILQNMRFLSYPNGHILQNTGFLSCPNGHILQNMGFPPCSNEHILQNKWALIRNYSSKSIKTIKNHQN